LDIGNNQLLRMMLALLILEALLAQDGGGQQAGAGAGSLSGNGSRGSMLASMMSVQSETSIVQIQHQSTTLATSHAVQSLGATSGDPQSDGSQLDVRA
jgi:hypothetical protein